MIRWRMFSPFNVINRTDCNRKLGQIWWMLSVFDFFKKINRKQSHKFENLHKNWDFVHKGTSK